MSIDYAVTAGGAGPRHVRDDGSGGRRHVSETASTSAATLAARVQEVAFRDLRAPIRILTAPATPVPAAASLEDAYLLDTDHIARAISELHRA